MSLDQRVFAWRGSYSNPRAGSGSLAGLRLGVKDLFHIAGLPTAAGNPDWLASHPIPEHTSPVVTQLLDAGAELVGKTQTDELAYSLNGLNIHYGAPLNPVAPDRLPGGSSSGSAVAVAAGDIDIGLGTDTGGSIRVPASYNGLFGIRTTHGLISSEHMVPLAPLFDTVGWFARDARTLARVGEVLLPDHLPRQFPNKPEHASLRIALLLPSQNGALWTPAHQDWLNQQALLTGVKPILLNSDWLNRASQCFRTLQARAIWQTHGDWITNQKPTFAPDIHARFQWCATLTDADQQAAEAERALLQAEIDSWFDDVDLILLPTTPGAAPLLGAEPEWMDNYRSQLMGLTAPAGLAGLPQVHLPVLNDQGAPCGVSLLGKRDMDKALLQLAIELCGDDGEAQ
ncbi:amidase [Cellvibrio sp. NN19]|uniref:amidase n=1 Tax=Cellvibrio chitinivorans TaxID=3102792 RepID=UPI002B4143D4|nr:amidase [Cellvibrio sp. NN19]